MQLESFIVVVIVNASSSAPDSKEELSSSDLGIAVQIVGSSVVAKTAQHSSPDVLDLQ
jgi:hypothetical protein